VCLLQYHVEYQRKVALRRVDKLQNIGDGGLSSLGFVALCQSLIEPSF